MRSHNTTPRASSACSFLISSATFLAAHVLMSMNRSLFFCLIAVTAKAYEERKQFRKGSQCQ